ncbi:hypothetical protein SAMN03080610_01648 [Afifella marina DSM 2698]|uniref:Uncharacterized protein n=1 Tax=Afifella marina DSM 2698 TaxID=1120955 RepID=A0A1G5NBP5_AFIMA|nr:hypothetical protein SAMN03080610_01648 [Afifella marina DSM 2698]
MAEIEENTCVNSEKAPRLSVDWQLYADALDKSDLTDDEKREFIETLWYIVVSFVDLGFGIDSVSHAIDSQSRSEPCAQVLRLEKDSPLRQRFKGANDQSNEKERLQKGRKA